MQTKDKRLHRHFAPRNDDEGLADVALKPLLQGEVLRRSGGVERFVLSLLQAPFLVIARNDMC